MIESATEFVLEVRGVPYNARCLIMSNHDRRVFMNTTAGIPYTDGLYTARSKVYCRGNFDNVQCIIRVRLPGYYPFESTVEIDGTNQAILVPRLSEFGEWRHSNVQASMSVSDCQMLFFDYEEE